MDKQNKADLKLMRQAVKKLRSYAGMWRSDVEDISLSDDALLAIDRIQEQLDATVPVDQPALL